MEEKKDSIIIRGFTLFLGIGMIVAVPFMFFSGELESKGLGELVGVCIVGFVFLMYGIGGSKLLRKLGYGSWVSSRKK
tara:strand:- start:226 stop:459 length:234 start_codon:yes stop_codon:yes gene_type:complete